MITLPSTKRLSLLGLMAMVLASCGCAVFVEGDIGPLEPWPPASGETQGTISLTIDGYKVHGRLLHRKNPELSQALAAAAYGDPDLQEMVLWGIGWEIEHRFEVAGKLNDVIASIRAIPTVDRGFVVEGIRWTGKRRIRTLEERAPKTAQDRIALNRVRALTHFAKSEQARLRAAAKKHEPLNGERGPLRTR